MSTECHVMIADEDRPLEPRWQSTLTFQKIPTIGEFVSFSRDGTRDENGVLHADLFRVKNVIHIAATDLNPPMVTLEVVLEQRARR